MPSPTISDLASLAAEIPLVQRLLAADPHCLTEGQRRLDELTLTTPPTLWLPLAQRLRSEGFDQFADLTCVDWYPAADRFEIVCQLHDTRKHQWVRIKTRCDEAAPPPTLSSIWPAANWFEREVFDLFGVRFAGHPNLTRMLMPDHWEGHPMRKDYAVEGPR